MAVYQLLGKGGATMVPVQTTGLKLGQVVSYWDMANPKQKAVVTSENGEMYGQPCIFVDTYSRSTVSITSIEGPGGWKLEKDPCWTPAQIAELQTKAAQAIIDRKQAQADKAHDFEKEKQALAAKYPYLIQGQGRVIAAKNIRIELKRAFPGVVFSVTGKSFSGGNSLDIDWTDGPTSKQVETITDKYNDGDFDGMTDCYNYRHSAWTEVFGSSKYVMESRSYSDTLVKRAITELIEEYGNYNVPTSEDYKQGNANKSPILDGTDYSRQYHDNWQSLINRKCSEIDCTASTTKSSNNDEINQKIIAAVAEQNRLLMELAKTK